VWKRKYSFCRIHFRFKAAIMHISLLFIRESVQENMIEYAVFQSNTNIAWFWRSLKFDFLFKILFSVLKKTQKYVFFQNKFAFLKKLEDISLRMVCTWSKSVQWFQRYSLLNLGFSPPPRLQWTFVKIICPTKVTFHDHMWWLSLPMTLDLQNSQFTNRPFLSNC